jgi:hypothetical protein
MLRNLLVDMTRGSRLLIPFLTVYFALWSAGVFLRKTSAAGLWPLQAGSGRLTPKLEQKR